MSSVILVGNNLHLNIGVIYDRQKNKGTDPKTYKFDTLSLHGYQPHKNSGSRQVPIYQTTSYLFDDVDHAAALFNLERGGHIGRISNPTVSVLEERVAALEGGTAALATSSGMSAIFAVMTLCEAVSSRPNFTVEQ